MLLLGVTVLIEMVFNMLAIPIFNIEGLEDIKDTRLIVYSFINWMEKSGLPISKSSKLKEFHTSQFNINLRCLEQVLWEEFYIAQADNGTINNIDVNVHDNLLYITFNYHNQRENNEQYYS